MRLGQIALASHDVEVDEEDGAPVGGVRFRAAA
jgi:hypothetical protein